jgi:hypothetical protein
MNLIESMMEADARREKSEILARLEARLRRAKHPQKQAELRRTIEQFKAARADYRAELGLK